MSPDSTLPDTPVLVFSHPRQPGDAVPVALVARVLGGLQKAVLELAAATAPGALNAAQKRRYELRCAVSAGEWRLSLGSDQLSLDLGLVSAPQQLLARLVALWGAIAAEAPIAHMEESLAPHARERVLDAMRRTVPRPAEGWTVRLGEHALTPPAARTFERHFAAAPTAPGQSTVTGELLGVDFETQRFSLRYGTTRKVLSGPYPPELEVWLLKQRRKTLQVDGEFALDPDGLPTACRSALSFRAVDLAPITLTRVIAGEQGLALDPPLVLEPRLDVATQQRFEAGDAALGLGASGTTREDLIAALEAQVLAMWEALGDSGPNGRAASDPVMARMWRKRVKPLQPAAAWDD